MSYIFLEGSARSNLPGNICYEWLCLLRPCSLGRRLMGGTRGFLSLHTHRLKKWCWMAKQPGRQQYLLKNSFCLQFWLLAMMNFFSYDYWPSVFPSIPMFCCSAFCVAFSCSIELSVLVLINEILLYFE